MRALRDEGLRRAVKFARSAAREPIDGMIVMTLRNKTDGSGATCDGVAFASPVQMVAAASYLLHRVREDAQQHFGDGVALEQLMMLDKAIALLGETKPGTLQ